MGEGDLSPRRPPQNTPPTARFQAGGGIIVKVIEAARPVRRLVRWMPMRRPGQSPGGIRVALRQVFSPFSPAVRSVPGVDCPSTAGT